MQIAMSQQFLCQGHRAELGSRPDAAIRSWAEWVQEGSEALQEGSLKKATTYFGCAFELAEMLVHQYSAHSVADGLKHVDRLLSAGDGLLACLEYGGEQELQQRYQLAIHERLMFEQMRTPLLQAELDGAMHVSIRRLNQLTARQNTVSHGRRLH